ncbi:MAG: asparagine synthetase A [Desulfurococcaceae archaeon]
MLEKIRIRAWIKPLNNNEILLWNDTGTARIRVTCNSDLLASLPCGSLVEITGKIGINGICIEFVKLIHRPIREDLACVEHVPEDPLEYTLRHHIYVRRPEVLKAVKTYFHVVNYMRTFLVKRGFVELPTVVLGHASDPGLRGASKVAVELYGRPFELQSSVIMYKQLYASVLDKVFYVAKNVRLEPPEMAFTGRHLVEFTQVDVECADSTSDELIRLGEVALYKTVKHVVNKHGELLGDREIERIELEVSAPPYPRLTYDEAIREALKMGINVRQGQELTFEAEAAIANKYGSPVWIVGFPSRSRGFYYIEDPERPGYNVDYNLLLPSGHGEVLDGGCREYTYERVVESIVKRHGESPEKYRWFLELLEAGLIRPTCGWGLGVERLVKYLQGLKHIAYATPHPRIPGIIGP